MKYIKSRKISKKKYELTIEVSDYDLEMLEDLATTYAPFKLYEDNQTNINYDFSLLDFTEKFGKWMMGMWKEFWKLWAKHDEENSK